MAKKVYLSGGIDGLAEAEARGWRCDAAALLAAAGFEVLDPCRNLAEKVGRTDELFHDIVTTDLADIVMSDYVLARCTRPSWGTAMEIRAAHEFRRRVVLFRDKWAVNEANTWSPWLIYHSHARLLSLESAVEYIIVSEKSSGLSMVV